MTWALREPNGQNKQVSCANLGKNQHDWRIGPAFGRAKAKQGPQQYAQIEPGKMDDGALLHIGQPAKMHPPHAAPVKAVGKTALHPLAPRTQQRLARTGTDPLPVPVHRFPGCNIPMPAQPPLVSRLADPACASIRQILQHVPAVTALVRHQSKGLVNAGRSFLVPDRAQPGPGVVK